MDLEVSKLSVRLALSEVHTGLKFEKPTNGKGRPIALSPSAAKVLRNHYAQKNERMIWSSCATLAQPMMVTNLTNRNFSRILSKASPRA